MKKHNVFIVFISLIVALGGFLLGFDSAVISGAVPFYRNVFGLESGSLLLGLSVSAIIFGAMGGNFIGGILADIFGRKIVLIMTAVLFTFCALATSLTSNLTFFIIARMIGGLGVGMSILVAPMYIAEIAPREKRGTLVSINQLNIVLGISVAYFSNYFILQRVTDPNLNWRWMLGVGAIPAVLYFLLLYFIPQSPRWLALKNRDDEAKKTLVNIGGEAYAAQVFKEIKENLGKSEKSSGIHFREVFQKKMTLILIIGLGIAFFQQITGINAIFYYAPMIFGMAGGGQDSAFAQAIILGLTNVVFTVVAMFLIDRLGRKPLLIIGSIGIMISLSIAGFAFKSAKYSISEKGMVKILEVANQNKESEPSDLVVLERGLNTLTNAKYDNEIAFFKEVKNQIGAKNYDNFKSAILENAISMNAILVLIGLILYVASFAISLGPVMWALLSEIFPNKMRGVMISIVGTWNSVVSFSVATIFPKELEGIGSGYTFLIFAFLGFLTLLFVLKYVPETKGKSLEELETILVRQ
jgi:sugar porter (SP) family MFS transporter